MRRIFLWATTALLLAGVVAYAGEKCKDAAKCTQTQCRGQQCSGCGADGKCIKG